jgi:phosphoribosyl 1,2-cyclic phosphate phosphodiesterase
VSPLEFVILGCGSSGGVPRGDGNWGACNPAEPRNRRTRCAALARRRGPGGVTEVLIDTSPDFRQQALAAGISRVDAVLYTHDHADQTHGIDDLRVFAMHERRRIPAYMDEATRAALTRRFDYIFESKLGYPALLEAQALPGHGVAWEIDGPGGDIPIVTFDHAHGPIRSVGYRVGGVAYSSDVSDVPDEAFEIIAGADVWIVDALRWTPHPTHAHVARSLEWIARSGVKRAVLTNLHIDIDYNAIRADLPSHIEPAYDGMTLTTSI